MPIKCSAAPVRGGSHDHHLQQAEKHKHISLPERIRGPSGEAMRLFFARNGNERMEITWDLSFSSCYVHERTWLPKAVTDVCRSCRSCAELKKSLNSPISFVSEPMHFVAEV